VAVQHAGARRASQTTPVIFRTKPPFCRGLEKRATPPILLIARHFWVQNLKASPACPAGEPISLLMEDVS
jgi:hypothetical protein